MRLSRKPAPSYRKFRLVTQPRSLSQLKPNHAHFELKACPRAQETRCFSEGSSAIPLVRLQVVALGCDLSEGFGAGSQLCSKTVSNGLEHDLAAVFLFASKVFPMIRATRTSHHKVPCVRLQ